MPNYYFGHNTPLENLFTIMPEARWQEFCSHTEPVLLRWSASCWETIFCYLVMMRFEMHLVYYLLFSLSSLLSLFQKRLEKALHSYEFNVQVYQTLDPAVVLSTGIRTFFPPISCNSQKFQTLLCNSCIQCQA